MTEKIEKALSLGKIKGATKLLQEYYLAQDRATWLASKQDEYDGLYKTVEVQVEAILDEDENVVTEAYTYMDYTEDTPSFTDWLGETVVVTEAVEATYDEEGMMLTEAIAEVREMVRPYVASDVSELVTAYINSKYAELRATEYPPMEDYLDAIVKNDEAAKQEYIDKCLAVKAKYPKA